MSISMATKGIIIGKSSAVTKVTNITTPIQLEIAPVVLLDAENASAATICETGLGPSQTNITPVGPTNIDSEQAGPAQVDGDDASPDSLDINTSC